MTTKANLKRTKTWCPFSSANDRVLDRFSQILKSFILWKIWSSKLENKWKSIYFFKRIPIWSKPRCSNRHQFYRKRLAHALEPRRAQRMESPLPAARGKQNSLHTQKLNRTCDDCTRSNFKTLLINENFLVSISWFQFFRIFYWTNFTEQFIQEGWLKLGVITETRTGVSICDVVDLELMICINRARSVSCFWARIFACFSATRSWIKSLWSVFIWSPRHDEYLNRRQQRRHFSGRGEFLTTWRLKLLEDWDIYIADYFL